MMKDLTPISDPDFCDPDFWSLLGEMLVRWVSLSMLLPLIVSCYGHSHYLQARNPSMSYGDPEDYRVDPSLYPKYRAVRDFQPPDMAVNPEKDPRLKMPRITMDCVWEVRHRVGHRLWIFCRDYEAELDKRACSYTRGFLRGSTSSCYERSVTEISIFEDGRVEGGWRGIKNPKHVFLKGDRAIPLNPDPRYDLSWGNAPLFEPIKK